MEQFLFIIKSILLGIVEGITEFLPISSTGHLIIFQNLIHFESNNPGYIEMYTYVIQLGAILAVVILYWKKIRDTLVNFFPKKGEFDKSGFKFWFVIGIACIPGVIVKLLLDDITDKYLFNPVSVAITLFVGGIFIICTENHFKKKYSKNRNRYSELNVSIKQALVIGMFQCLAIIPGMSRSASTIIGGWFAGFSSVAAAEFSFFLAIPVMLGMSALEIISVGGLSSFTSLEVISLGVGFFVSFVVALIVVRKFISYLQTKPMRIFAVYRMLFAIIVLVAGLNGLF